MGEIEVLILPQHFLDSPRIDTKSQLQSQLFKLCEGTTHTKISEKGEMLNAQMDLMNTIDKNTVATMRDELFAGHLTKGKTVDVLQKLFLYPLKGDKINKYAIEMIRKQCNLGEREDLEVLCLLHCKGINLCIDRLRNILHCL